MVEVRTRFSAIPREHPKLVRGTDDHLVVILEPIDGVFAKRGIYGDDGLTMPKRYRFMDPAAHESLMRIENDYPRVFFYSDVFRNAAGSAKRRRKNRDRRIAQSKSAIYTGKIPGSSGHGFGLCLDHSVSDNLRRLRRFLKEPGLSKAGYDLIWRNYGWYCHRDGPDGGDHDRGREDWHFSYFGDDPNRWLSHSGQKTSGGLEAKLIYNHGPFTLDEHGVVTHLIGLGFLTMSTTLESAIRRFQSEWTLAADGIAGPQTQRALLYVGAEFRDASGSSLLNMT